MSEQLPQQYLVRAIPGLPDFRPGDDLVGALGDCAPWLADGDILAVTSKVISKIEGRLVPAGGTEEERYASRQQAIDHETEAVVAQRDGVRIVRTRHGLTMAAAGVDASNVRADEIALLPEDCDASARRIRDGVRDRLGLEIAVIVTDTVGRPWRAGQVDIALGAAGLPALRDLRGATDTHGNPLVVTALAQIDELASASELVRGKLGQVGAAVIRGVPWQEAPPEDAGAASLVRPVEQDFFCLGARDVVPATVLAEWTTSAARDEQIAAALERLPPPTSVTLRRDGDRLLLAGAAELELGVYAGRLTVALRAEGVATRLEPREQGLTIECAAAGPYRGMPR